MPIAGGSLPTRTFGVVVLAAATAWCAANVRFIAVHAQGCRPLTVPLVAVLLCLGLLRWRWQLLLFVFLAPLLYWLPAMDDAVRLRLVKLMFPFVLLFWGARLVSPSVRPLPATRIVPPLFLYIGLAVLSAGLTLWRYYPLLSWDTVAIVGHDLVDTNRATWWNWLRPDFGIVRESLVYVTGPLFLLLLLHSADTALVASLRRVLLCSLAIAAFVAVCQKFAGAQSLRLSVWGREGLQRVYGTLGDANTFGAYLALLLPLLLVEAFLLWRPDGQRRATDDRHTEHRMRWLVRCTSLTSIGLVVAALVWTASRAAVIGTVVAMLWGARLWAEDAARRRGQSPSLLRTPAGRYAVLALLCVGAAVATYGRLTAVPFKEWRSPANAFLALFNPDRLHDEVRGRWFWWKPALRMGTELPLTGVGIGQYRFFDGPYWPGPQQFGILGDPHNTYLKPLAELGFPGLVLFLWICWATWRTWRARPPLPPGGRRYLRRLAVGAGLVALAADMLFQHVLVQSEMQVIGATVVALAVLDESGHVPGPPDSMKRRGLRLTALAAVAAAIIWAGRYKGATVHTVSPATMEKWDRYTATETGVYLRGRAGLSRTLGQHLDRALVVVAARAEKVAGQWPRLMLEVNGDYITEWPIDSAGTKLFKRAVYTTPGANRFLVKILGYYRDPKTGVDRSIYVDRLTVLGGHLASHFDRLDPPAMQRELTRLLLRTPLEPPRSGSPR